MWEQTAQNLIDAISTEFGQSAYLLNQAHYCDVANNQTQSRLYTIQIHYIKLGLYSGIKNGQVLSTATRLSL